MNTPLQQLFNWSHRNEHATVIPDYLYAPAARQHDIKIFVPADTSHAAACEEARALAMADMEAYSARRQIEHDLAGYLDKHGMYPDLSEKLRHCRMTGALGVKPNGDRVIAWDQKCNLNRLCPDEAREEQQRLAERYTPVIRQWQREKRGRQVQYCVLTWPNVEPERLHVMKRAMAKQVAAWLKRYPCRAIKGALVTQEDPLSANLDFNVHTNLILLVEGRFDWAAARADWFAFTRRFFAEQQSFGGDFQCYFRDITRGNLTKAVMELVKYAAKHVTTKADAGKTAAPGLTEWPPELFDIWWQAGRNFRRTRSYGVLFRVPPVDERSELQEVEWIGSVRFDVETSVYSVSSINLIPAHNSGSGHALGHRADHNSHGPPG